MTPAPADIASFPSAIPKRDRVPPPLSLWIIAALVSLLFGALIYVSPNLLDTPLPIRADRRAFAAQLAKLDTPSAATTGAEPLRVVFIGTSRMKNAAFSAADVARSAAAAGVRRPVANTYVALNWGGGERLAPAFDLLDHRPPDALIVMPGLLRKDLSHFARMRMSFLFLESYLRTSDYSLFGDEEQSEHSCDGFDRPADARDQVDGTWLVESYDRPGPHLVRDRLRKLAANGTLVFVATVPVSSTLARIRKVPTSAEVVAKSGLAGQPNIRPIELPQSFPDKHYCDWAHLRPEQARVWQRALFERIADPLNRR